ncbi:MAG TPA: oligopeptide transporter, OPT family [Candidatus Acidoferrales bacterium]|nr:oligopeptide transporter, OPT family [Candidatus Acidoferrales bacterium]
MASKPWSSIAPPGEFHPYIPPEKTIAEFTPRAIILGIFAGLFFGAITVYVGLRAGLTVSASIPIAVLSISILRAFGKSTILENNIVQTTGSAGESIAGGVIFTLPALIFLGFPLQYWTVFFLALLGGWLGVLFMIPLRRQLIVKEHGNLLYPEGTACADVLVAGDKGGSFAGRVFLGFGLGGLYAFLMETMGFWPDTPEYRPGWLPGASFRANITPEYMGVGYIIGPRVAGLLFAGGVFSWLVLMPAIKFFGGMMTHPLFPGLIPIGQMTPDDLYRAYIRPMGAGAVAASGVITLFKTMPTIVTALRAGLKDVRKSRAVESAINAVSRVERDFSMKIVALGSLAVVAMMWALLTWRPIPGAKTGLLSNLIAAVFVVIFGFLFVTVSSRICGLIGNSSNPISGMAIATLMATCAMFLVAGWTGGAFSALAITIGGVVCVASSNAGGTSQDLKTGYLVGATPSRQQLALMIGVMTSVFAVGGTLNLMNVGLEEYKPVQIAVNVNQLPSGVSIENQSFTHAGKAYVLLNAIGSHVVPDGNYLYDSATHEIDLQWVHGIGSEKASAPQARLMATVINGILQRQLPWRLVLVGVFLVITVELLGVRSLPFAVGAYLPVDTTMAMFAGGVIRWLAERGMKKKDEAGSEIGPGPLFASGLIAGGGIFGLLGIVIYLFGDPNFKYHFLPEHFLHAGPQVLGALASSRLFGVIMFALLGASQFYYARRKMD